MKSITSDKGQVKISTRTYFCGHYYTLIVVKVYAMQTESIHIGTTLSIKKSLSQGLGNKPFPSTNGKMMFSRPLF